MMILFNEKHYIQLYILEQIAIYNINNVVCGYYVVKVWSYRVYIARYTYKIHGYHIYTLIKTIYILVPVEEMQINRFGIMVSR